jgi:tetratricopeptide (TPR) repeat protein
MNCKYVHYKSGPGYRELLRSYQDQAYVPKAHSFALQGGKYFMLVQTLKKAYIHSLVMLWRFIVWSWKTIIIGAIVLGIISNAFYIYVTKGQFDSIDTFYVPLVQLIKMHLFVSIVITLFCTTIILLSFFAHKKNQKLVALASYEEYILQQVKHLNPNNFLTHYYDTYISRDADVTVRKTLQNLATQKSIMHKSIIGICIIGPPMQGKTRLAWEAIQTTLPDWTLVRWPLERLNQFDFSTQKGQNLVVWLDDLHKFAKSNEALTITNLPHHFFESKANVIIVATCCDGDDQIQAQRHLENLLERLYCISLPNISANAAVELTRMLTDKGVPVHYDEFNGTPGSILLGVDKMRKRYHDLPLPAQKVLKTLKLLYSVHIYKYTEARTCAVAHDIFLLDQSEWREAYESLDQEGFIKLSFSSQSERILEPLSDRYLEEKVITNYPLRSAPTNDWPQLKECFTQLHDTEALNELGTAFLVQREGNIFFNKRQAEICFRSTLSLVNRKKSPSIWAITQLKLGIALSEQALTKEKRKERYPLLEEALTAFQNVLQVFTRKSAPTEWAETQSHLGIVLKEQALTKEKREERYPLLEEALTAFQAALSVWTQKSVPTEWAETQSHLGIVLKEQALTKEKREERYLLLNQALISFQNALQVYTPQLVPNEWARTQSHLGIVLKEQALTKEKQEERYPLLEEALTAFQNVLQVFTRESAPTEWAEIQSHLGIVLKEQALTKEKQEERYPLLEEALTAFQNVLQVFTRKSAPTEWTMAQFNLGIVLEEQAQMAEGQERHKLLEEALTAFEDVLQVFTREVVPIEWAKTQFNLGLVLKEQAQMAEGQERHKLLEEALTAFQQDLQVRTREVVPIEWAKTQFNLGLVLKEQAQMAEGQEHHRLLEEALTAFEDVLQVFTRASAPKEWAMTQTSLSNVLCTQANSAYGIVRRHLLERATAALKTTLLIWTQESTSEWALVQNNLGNILREQTRFAEGQERRYLLEEALTAFQQSLQVRTREVVPIGWATTQFNLGLVLKDQAQMAEGQERRYLLKEALTAFEDVLQVFTRASAPNDWAKVQEGLGEILNEQAMLAEGQEHHRLLEEALTAFEDALQVFTRASAPNEWAKTQNSLSIVLCNQADSAYGIVRLHLLERATTALKATSLVWTQEPTSIDWALVQGSLGNILNQQAMLAKGQERHRLLEETLTAFQQALQIFTRESTPIEWAKTQNNLGFVLNHQAMLAEGQERHRLLEAAIAAYQQALLVLVREQFPLDWRMTQNNIGIAMKEQAKLIRGFQRE